MWMYRVDMVANRRWWLTSCFFLIFAVPFFGQSDFDRHFNKGKAFVEHQQYHQAIPYLDSAYLLRPDHVGLRELMAHAYFYAGDLENAYVLVQGLFSESRRFSESLLHLRAAIYHHRLEFDEAIRWYKQYISVLPPDHSDRLKVANQIRRASSGLRMPGRRMDLLVESMGPEINTPGDEIRPLFSPNIRERIYFSSNREGSTGGRTDHEGRPDSVFGHLSMDMYMAELRGGQWDNVVFLNEDLNSRLNDIAIDFSWEGRVLYHFRGFSQEVGRVFVDTFGVDKPGAGYMARFVSPFVPELGDQGLSFVSDSVIVFSSNRPGGFGGYDLYIALKRNGKWSDAINLGPEVNSEFDELDPFISNGGRELFFSSNRLSSIGEFDIFHARFNVSKGRWADARNVGMPLNSSGNDRYFRISNDGNTCVFASDRKGGRGGYDLYLAYFREEWQDQFEELSTDIVHSFFPPPEVPVFIEFQPERVLELFGTEQGEAAVEPEEEITEIAERLEESDTESESETDPTESPEEVDEAISETGEPEDKDEEVLILEPWYYDESGNIRYPENIEKARRLAQLMQNNPGLELKLSSFSAHTGPIHLDLFFSINKAEEIANILIDEGVDPARITVVGYGSQYPLALNQVNREPFYPGQEANRRVEPQLFLKDRLYENVVFEGKLMPESYGSSRYRDFGKEREGITFKVQIGAAKSMLNIPAINRYSHPKIERPMSGEFYRYTVGLEKTFERVEVFRDQLKASGIDNAYIVPYLDGKRLSTARIAELSGIFEELKHFN